MIHPDIHPEHLDPYGARELPDIYITAGGLGQYRFDYDGVRSPESVAQWAQDIRWNYRPVKLHIGFRVYTVDLGMRKSLDARSARCTRLIEYLRTEDKTLPELSHHLKVSTRTVEEYIRELRELGADIRSVPGNPSNPHYTLVEAQDDSAPTLRDVSIVAQERGESATW